MGVSVGPPTVGDAVGVSVGPPTVGDAVGVFVGPPVVAVGVLVAPVVPGLTDHEAAALVAAAAEAGARTVRHIMLRLPYGLGDLFEAWLERHFPERKRKVMQRVRAMRDGKLNDARFFSRQLGSGFFAEQTHQLFALAMRRAGLADALPPLSTAAFRRPGGEQLGLFGG